MRPLTDIDVDPDRCAMRPEDDSWVIRATEAWSLSLRESLHLQPRTDPVTFVFFDTTCVYRSTGSIARRGRRHEGAIGLPEGKPLPVQVTSFAAPYEKNRRVFMAMALPDIWRAAGIQSELTLESLMVSVFVHEMTHTRQFRGLTPAIDALDARWKLGNDLNDDIVQTRRYRDNAMFFRPMLMPSASCFIKALPQQARRKRAMQRGRPSLASWLAVQGFLPATMKSLQIWKTCS